MKEEQDTEEGRNSKDKEEEELDVETDPREAGPGGRDRIFLNNSNV